MAGDEVVERIAKWAGDQLSEDGKHFPESAERREDREDGGGAGVDVLIFADEHRVELGDAGKADHFLAECVLEPGEAHPVGGVPFRDPAGGAAAHQALAIEGDDDGLRSWGFHGVGL